VVTASSEDRTGTGSPRSAPRTARARARIELTRDITEAARRQLAEVGAAHLSLRAVARELGMASSAVYRYFASRDELLTALIVDAYDAIGETAERTDEDAVRAGASPIDRWRSVCRAVRDWAIAHPHEWALVYGSPVTGYAAPQDTVVPAGRMARVLATIATDAHDRGTAGVPSGTAGPPPDDLLAADVTALFDGAGPGFAERGLLTWISLIGAINFELFGHLHNVVEATDSYFDWAMDTTAELLGMLESGGAAG
jgi:AcrR family transcriptional regulator